MFQSLELEMEMNHNYGLIGSYRGYIVGLYGDYVRIILRRGESSSHLRILA